ncbi:hypothetical protein HID58_056475, partial [Brassica napus]
QRTAVYFGTFSVVKRPICHGVIRPLIYDSLLRRLVLLRSVRCKLESSAPIKPPELMRLHAVCFHELKTAVVLLGDTEIHLVAMPSKEKKEIVSEYNVYEHMVITKIKGGLAFGVGVFALKSVLKFRCGGKENS